MKKLTLIFLISLYVLISLEAQEGHFHLKGKTNNIPDSTMLLLTDPVLNEPLDSTLIINNQFSFSGDIATPFKEAFLMTQYEGAFEYAYIFLEPSEMLFDASQSNFRKAKVSGSVTQAQADELQSISEPWIEKALQTNEQVYQISQNGGDTTGLAKLKRESAYYFRKNDEITKDFISKHPDYFISVKSLTFLKNNLPKKEVETLYLGLSSELQKTKDGQSIKLWLDESVVLEIGDKAPDFELPNLQNRMVSLSNFTEKFVLLEFGASNCGPCRYENANLLAAYKGYKDQGFEIVSVWLDSKKKNWSKTVEKDQMIWTSLCDLKGNKGQVPLTYSVTKLPTNYLLDQNGIVIAKDLRGEELHKTLEALFNSESVNK